MKIQIIFQILNSAFPQLYCLKFSFKLANIYFLEAMKKIKRLIFSRLRCTFIINQYNRLIE